MLTKLKQLLNQDRTRIRQYTHGEYIEKVIMEHKDTFNLSPVFVETGCGISTISLNKCAEALNAQAFSLDYNREKCDELKSRFGDKVRNIQFIIDDSLKTLPLITKEHQIDFLFLDSAASAMHTFREFQICESALGAGACLLIDNAALPNEKDVLSPVRKGKILVHYLLASPYWEVFPEPKAGDSMILSVRHDTPDYFDPAYEDPGFIDNWRDNFDKSLT